MYIRLLSLFTVAAARLFCASGPTNFPPQTAVFYSFDQRPSDTMLNELQDEFARILDPAGVPVQWRELSGNQVSDFRDIYVIRFHGACTPDRNGEKPAPLALNDRTLAETQISDGHVLPFADVRCNELRRYMDLSPRSDATLADAVFGKAVARVVAHEMFHMLTGSTVHCGNGVARAEYSRDNLLAASFEFGADEKKRLQQRHAQPEK